jgi:hypothetical protein
MPFFAALHRINAAFLGQQPEGAPVACIISATFIVTLEKLFFERIFKMVAALESSAVQTSLLTNKLEFMSSVAF